MTDFYKASPDNYYKEIVFSLAEKIVAEQKVDAEDILTYGSWWKVYSTSGVGWLSEVMTDTYRFCLEQNMAHCEKYKDAALKAMRLLIQDTYSTDNNPHLKNPDMAIGGVFWNTETPYVRTDSVCHALNGYTRLMNYLEDGILLSVPADKTLDK